MTSPVQFWGRIEDVTVAPFPSVPKDQLCSMLISAIVVEEFGMAPYWLSSRMFMTAGFTKPSTTNSSATLEIQGVRDIGLNYFWMSTTGFFLGRGVTSAIFQMVGRRCSA